jgi:Transglycosylase-like domain
MRKRIAVIAAGIATLGAPAVAQGIPSEAPGHFVPYDENAHYEGRYLDVRQQYVKRFGLEEAGRNIVRDGYRADDGSVHPAGRSKIVASTRTMDAALHPAAAASTTTTSTAASPTSTGYAGGAASSSSTAQCESGGSYTAVNPAGYYGAYQFDQQTWDAYAPAGYQGVNPASAPPAIQDQAAANVPYDAWPSC